MALSPKETKKALDNSIKDGALSDAKYGFSDYFTTPFALALGATSEMIGVMDSVIQFIGTASQPFATKIINKVGSRKKVSIICSLIQRSLWLPVMLIPFLIGAGDARIWLLIALLSFAYLFRSINLTSWTSWMLDIVPEKIRGRFFAKKSSIGNIAYMIAVIMAGALLQWFDGTYGFTLIFGIGLLLGFGAIIYMRKVPDLKLSEKCKRFHFSYRHFLHGVRNHENHSNFVFFMVFVEFARNIHAPFIVVFLLRDLHLGYFWFSVLSSILILSLTIFQIYWGGFSDKYGHNRTLKITYTLLPLIPVTLLFISPAYSFMAIILMLMIYFIFDGFASAGFDLSAFNYLLETAPKEESHVFIANYRFLTGIAISLAYLTGGFLATQYFEGSSFLWMTGLQILFLVSILLRITFPLVFISRFQPVFHKKSVNGKKLFVNALTTYPKRELVHEAFMLSHYMHKIEKRMFKLSGR